MLWVPYWAVTLHALSRGQEGMCWSKACKPLVQFMWLAVWNKLRSRSLPGPISFFRFKMDLEMFIWWSLSVWMTFCTQRHWSRSLCGVLSAIRLDQVQQGECPGPRLCLQQNISQRLGGKMLDTTSADTTRSRDHNMKCYWKYVVDTVNKIQMF